jgi:ATP-binding cassette subfamily B multidrug efflux pump
MNSLQMIVRYWGRSKKDFIISTILQLISTVFTLFSPIFLGKLIGQLSESTISTVQPWDLWINFILIITMGILAYLFGRTGRIKSAEVSTRALYYLRQDIHDAIYKQSFSYFDKHETGQLVARATSDVDQTEFIFGFGLAVGLQALLMMLGTLFSSFLMEPRLAWIFLIIVPSSFIISIFIVRKMRPIYIETRQSFGDLTNTIRENIIGAQVVRMFNMQDKEANKFDLNNKKFFQASVQSVKYSSLFMPINYILISFMFIAILFIGGSLILNGTMNLNILITFQSYGGIIIFPLIFFGQILQMYVQADASLIRIREVLESTPDIKEDPNAIPISNMEGNVEFDNVSFGYTASSRVLNNISFKLPAGKKIAVIGTTGSGKSSIINLLPRFYDINEGSIKIDGIDIRKYKIDDLRRNIGIVSQDTFLFNKSIKDNIKFGKENASTEEIIESAKIADLHDFIETLPEKYETIVGERGTKLSGGQKQRLSIARAIILKPKILVFDDSTSSVDVETEYHIQQELEKLMKGTTTFIITQRISTIRNANQIVVLDKGRIVGLGSHEQLIENNVLYRQIYETLFHKQSEILKPINPSREVKN